MAFPPTHGKTPNQRRLKGGEDQAHVGERIDLNHASKQQIMSVAGPGSPDGRADPQVQR